MLQSLESPTYAK